MLPWLSVSIASFVIFGGIAGGVVYLSANSDEIAEEMRAKRPAMLMEPIELTKSEEPEPAEETLASADDPDANPPEAKQEETAEDSGVSSDDDNPLLALMDDQGTESSQDAAESTGSTPSVDSADSPAEETTETEASEQNDTATSAQQDSDFVEEALIPHPDPSLVEETSIGALPKIAEDGRTPWQVYSRPYNALETRPQIAVLVTDLGLSEERTKAAVELPGAISLGFAPYARKSREWITKAREAGHEVLITLPMEPIDYPQSDPGPFALLTSLDAKQNIEKLNWVMSRSTGYIGMVNFLGSKFNTKKDLLRPVFGELAQRGLIYVETAETVVSVVPELGREMKVPTLTVDVIIDDPATRQDILVKLLKVETLAKTRGYALALAHGQPGTLERLKDWSRKLSAKGIALIPVSGIIASGLNAGGSGGS